MSHLLHGALLFIIAVFGRWQIWLSGSGVGGFVVIASSLIEKLFGVSLSRKAHLFIFVIAFFLCSCLLAWIDEHDSGVVLARQVKSGQESLASQRKECDQAAGAQKQDIAVKDAVNRELEKQNRSQENLISGCQTQALKLLTPKEFTVTALALPSQTRQSDQSVYIIIVNRALTPFTVMAKCDADIRNMRVSFARKEEQGVAAFGRIGGGFSRPSSKEWGETISVPAISPENPAIVYVDSPGKKICSFSVH
jgi:hypothetical protein